MYRFPMARPAEDPLAPPALYERLRAEEPVTKATMSDGTEAWLVARYDEVRAVLRELPVSADITKPGFPKILPLMQALPPDVSPPFVLMDPPVSTPCSPGHVRPTSYASSPCRSRPR
jgi:cytochrome P450